jgi:hypothetical protein
VTVLPSERPSTTPAPFIATGPVVGVQVQGPVSAVCGRPPSSVSTPAPAQTIPTPTRGCHELQEYDGFVYAVLPTIRPWSLMSEAAICTTAWPAAEDDAGSSVYPPVQVNGTWVSFGFAMSVDAMPNTTPELLTPKAST